MPLARRQLFFLAKIEPHDAAATALTRAIQLTAKALSRLRRSNRCSSPQIANKACRLSAQQAAARATPTSNHKKMKRYGKAQSRRSKQADRYVPKKHG